jgi:type I restriction enzyme M protein
LSGESVDDTGKHIRDLLKQARKKSKYKELFNQPGDDEFSISNSSIRKVVETFQGFSFVGNSIIGIDAKGTVYENMVGSTFRGELGQYFTPRKLVEFMVNLLKPDREDLVLDPACGSGGFLIYVLRKVAAQIRIEQQNLPTHKVEQLIRDYANSKIHGADLSPRMVRAARMNMIMHGDGWSGIHRNHGLLLQECGLKYDSYNLILSNPPFAGFEKDHEILKNFDVGKNEAGNIRGVNRAIVFVEQIVKLLKPDDGVAALVLPRSIFENESYSFKTLRDTVLKHCEIIACVGLPKTAFHHTDCGILGDLLFIRKCSNPRKDYNVFIAWADDVGYNTLGHNIDKNNLPDLLKAFDSKDKKYLIKLSELKKEDNWNPWHYHPEAKKLRKKVSSGKKTIPLTELVSIYDNRISRKNLKQTPDRIVDYLEVRDFDPLTGKYTPTKRKAKELPSRATYELNGEEFILLPNAKNSIESKRRIIKIDSKSNGMILTNRFTPLRPKVNPDYLLLVLNTDFVRNQIMQKCTGAGAPDLRAEKLNQVMIPVPNPQDLSEIDAFMEGIEDNLARRKKLQNEIEEINQNIQTEIKKIGK